MTLEDIREYFGGSYLFSKKTGMAYSNYQYWKKVGYIPIQTQFRIEKITGGTLKANIAHARDLD